MHDEWVTVLATPDPMEAEIAKGALEAYGVQAILFSDSLRAIIPAPADPHFGKFRLKVRAEEEALARAILEGPSDTEAPDPDDEPLMR